MEADFNRLCYTCLIAVISGVAVNLVIGGGGMKRPADDGGMDNGGPPKRFCNGEGPTIELRVLIQSKVSVSYCSM